MDLKTLNNRMDKIYSAPSAIPISTASFSPKGYLDTRKKRMKYAMVSKPVMESWVSKGAPFQRIASNKTRDLNGFLGTSIDVSTPVVVGSAVVAALIGWGLWSTYQNKKTEIEAANSEIAVLKAQAVTDEGRRQELLGQAVVLQNNIDQMNIEKEALRVEIVQKIDSLPPEEYVKLPGEVIEEVKRKSFPWAWLIIGGLLIGGVIVWTKRNKLSLM